MAHVRKIDKVCSKDDIENTEFWIEIIFCVETLDNNEEKETSHKQQKCDFQHSYSLPMRLNLI